jgi:MoaA/NifB/PqqE/SkfB family radical SAM enzyme
MHASSRSGPATVWIELTSKCPLRCIFCSRENLRGEGEHLNVATLESLLRSLENPEILRLNYSGESANYPWLIEAITMAKRLTPASTEMVTSLVTMPMEGLDKLVSSGIDRISVSIHSLDQFRFPMIYGGGTLEAFDRRLERLLSKAKQHWHPPIVDFAMVGMDSNIDEVGSIAALAKRSGVATLSIHPVIQRPGVPLPFAHESRADGTLTDEFQSALAARINQTKAAHPGLQISVARPSICTDKAFICEQNPFETTHILANGDVVVCEVLDRVPLGNVNATDFREIWKGAKYSEFRERYLKNDIPECATCIFRAGVPEVGALKTRWGWYAVEDSGTIWSRVAASFECVLSGHETLIVGGALPPGSPANSVEFARDGRTVARVINEGDDTLPFSVEIELDRSQDPNRFSVNVSHGFSPWRRGLSHDTRELGFALFSASLAMKTAPLKSDLAPIVPQPIRSKGADHLLRLLRPLEIVAGLCEFEPKVKAPADSLAVIVPERGNAAMLAECLTALEIALKQAAVRSEVVVVVNGSPRDDYREIANQHSDFRFVFIREPLGFGSSIRMGLRSVNAGWTYLLNSDMLLEPDALTRLWNHRAAGVFSLASRINMIGETTAHETNRTGIEMVDGIVNLLELGADTHGPVEHLYSGGGSSLFQTEWLRRFVARTICYDPFYWEDVEWGIWAKHAGLRNLFVPDSRARHAGGATIRKFYQPEEVFRIFERNRIQFQLRCVTNGDTGALRERLSCAPEQSLRELLTPSRITSMARTRAILAGLDHVKLSYNASKI